MIERINNTKSLSKIGALVSVDTNNPEAFVYTTQGSSKALGVVMEAKPYKSLTRIATIGDTAKVLVSGNVVKGNIIRANKKQDRISLGVCAVAKDTDSPFLRIGEALESGKGLIKVVLELSYQGTDSSGYVPYSGATADVDLGTHGITIGDSLTMTGDGRVWRCHWLGFEGLKAPGVKPATYTDHGIAGAWSFADGDTNTVVFNLKIPEDMDITEAPHFLIGWSTATTVTTETAVWQMEYLYTAIGEDTTAVAQDTQEEHSNAIAQANGLIVVQFDDMDLPGSSDVCLHCRLERLGSDGDDDLTDTAELHGVCFRYVSNKQGTAL